MEDTSMMSDCYSGNLERVSQDKCARTLTSCYKSMSLFVRICVEENFDGFITHEFS